MVSWKGAAALLVVLAALAYFVYQSRQPKAQPAAHALVPCDISDALDVSVRSSNRATEVARPGLRDRWSVRLPSPGPADQTIAEEFVNSVGIVKAIGSAGSGDLAQYGLDAPRLTVVCHVNAGASYTLSIGKPSFDGSGYYALKGGDSRVYVISGVPVDEFDRQLQTPPYAGAGATPSSSPST